MPVTLKHLGFVVVPAQYRHRAAIRLPRMGEFAGLSFAGPRFQSHDSPDFHLHREISGRPNVGAALGEQQIDFRRPAPDALRSEEHTSELPSLMRISYALFCLK